MQGNNRDLDFLHSLFSSLDAKQDAHHQAILEKLDTLRSEVSLKVDSLESVVNEHESRIVGHDHTFGLLQITASSLVALAGLLIAFWQAMPWNKS